MRKIDFLMRKKLRRIYPGQPEEFIRSPFALIGLDMEEQEKIIFKYCGVSRKEYYDYYNKIKEIKNEQRTEN